MDNLSKEKHPMEEENEDKKYKLRHRLTDIEVEEVSSVDNPANNRPFLIVKRKEDNKQNNWTICGDENLPVVTVKDWDSDCAKIKVSKWATEEENIDINKYQRAFVIKDLEGSNKIQFADIVDGELKAVEKGLIEAKQELLNSEDNIPDEIKEIALKFINNYLEKVEEEVSGEKNMPDETIDKQEQVEKEDIVEEDSSILGRTKSTLLLLKKSINNLKEGGEDFSGFKEAATSLVDLSSEIEKEYRAFNEMKDELRSGDDPVNPNAGSGVQPDVTVVSSFKEMLERTQETIREAADLEKLNQEKEQLKSEIENKDSEIEKLNEELKELQKYKEELAEIKKFRSASSASCTIDEEVTKESPDESNPSWPLFMN